MEDFRTIDDQVAAAIDMVDVEKIGTKPKREKNTNENSVRRNWIHNTMSERDIALAVLEKAKQHEKEQMANKKRVVTKVKNGFEVKFV